jgi:prepilin-type N-terminal cleavage/methylation domain-containing protein
MSPVTPRAQSVRGFTLIEAMVAMTIVAIAGSALLLGVESSLNLAQGSLEQTIAAGMAQQLMDEIVGGRYMAVGASPDQVPFCPSPSELATGTRELFDDIDDYDGWVSRPPEDMFGIELGADNGKGGRRHASFQAPTAYLDLWEQQVRVKYVNATNLSQSLSSGQTSDYRAVEVRIVYNDPHRGPRELAKLRRVVAYVPSL